MAKMLLQRQMSQMSASSSRRGSFMSTETTKRSSVVNVVDKKAEDKRLSGMVEDDSDEDEGNQCQSNVKSLLTKL